MKLSRSTNKIVRETVEKIGRKSASITRTNILNRLKPPLKPFTKIMRDKGLGWGGEKVGKPIGGNIPLLQTGRLYKSIKYNQKDKALEIPAYGFLHEQGFTSIVQKRAKGYAHKKIFKGMAGISKEKPSVKFIKVPPRPFIANATEKKHNAELIKIKKNFSAKIRKALKTGVRIKSGFQEWSS